MPDQAFAELRKTGERSTNTAVAGLSVPSTFFLLDKAPRIIVGLRLLVAVQPWGRDNAEISQVVGGTTV